jgi:hypothetical protein
MTRFLSSASAPEHFVRYLNTIRQMPSAGVVIPATNEVEIKVKKVVQQE